MSDDELNIECDICFDDIIASNKYFLDKNPLWQKRIKKIRRIGIPAASVILALGIVLVVLGVGVIGGIFAIVFGVLGIVLMIIFPAAVWRRYEKYMRKKYCYVPHGDVGSYSYEVTEDGIRMVSRKGAVRLKWHEVRNIVQTPSYIFIDITPDSSAIIPKGAFADDAAFEQAGRDLIERLQRHKAAQEQSS